ncbi:hypothetical protein T484DRAFT_1954303 [Baffinella frigidus]|nr:hypothetical protein T484DRAFT_1954303 [Cryptophyta sp. CCMP2293]
MAVAEPLMNETAFWIPELAIFHASGGSDSAQGATDEGSWSYAEQPLGGVAGLLRAAKSMCAHVNRDNLISNSKYDHQSLFRAGWQRSEMQMTPQSSLGREEEPSSCGESRSTVDITDYFYEMGEGLMALLASSQASGAAVLVNPAATSLSGSPFPASPTPSSTTVNDSVRDTLAPAGLHQSIHVIRDNLLSNPKDRQTSSFQRVPSFQFSVRQATCRPPEGYRSASVGAPLAIEQA